MLKSDELAKEINEKRAELEKLQQARKLSEAKNLAKELNDLVDAYDIELAKEKSDFENFLRHATPVDSSGKQDACGGISGADYRKNFLSAIRNKFKGEAVNYLRESTLPDGGYLVPNEFHKEIVSELEEENVLRKIGTTFATESSHRIPIVATRPAASWIGEGEEINFANETFGQVTLEAYKLAVAIKVSNELLNDSFYPIERHLVHEFSLAFGRAEENAFLTGTTAQNSQQKNPTGILPTLATSPTTTITTTTTELTVDDLLNLEFALKRPYRKNAVWLMSDSLLAIVRKMKDNDERFVWQSGMTDAEPEKIFGYPVYTSPFMPAVTSGNVVALFGDFKNYYFIGERGQRVFKPLRELYAMSDQTAFLMLERVDAVLTNLEAIKALKLR